MTANELIDFERRVADAFASKQIHAPIHLSGGNERQLIDYFEQHVKPADWICTGWRSHYHALLKGIPQQWVFDEIIAGRSMSLMNAEYRFISSAIVGGILPIACGIAWGIKQNGGKERVHVFVGDMTARTGLYHEFCQYCRGHELPVRIVIEDNGVSTNADTQETWGRSEKPLRLTRYRYKRTYPHCGLTQRVNF